MKEVDGRTFADKQTVARRLIHAAIRNSLEGECAISNQVIIGSATTLMTEVAVGLGKKSLMDPANYVKPEYAQGMSEALKSFYNFFKHGNYDADQMIDVTNLTLVNDIQIFGAVCEYQVLHGSMSEHMKLFFAAMTILHPAVYDWDLLKQTFPNSLDGREHFKGWSRDDLLKLLAEAAEQGPANAEAADDRVQLAKGGGTGYYDGPPTRDMFKRPA